MVGLYIILGIESLITLVACFCLSKLYIKNSAYSRDAVLVIAGLSTIALSVISISSIDNCIMGQTLLTQVCMSLFLLGNIKSKKTKWASNLAKSIILCLFATAIAINNVVLYQMCLMTIALINFLFTFINFNKISTRVFDISENIVAIIVMSMCYNNLIYQNTHTQILLLCSIIVFNCIIMSHMIFRVHNLSRLFKSMKD